MAVREEVKEPKEPKEAGGRFGINELPFAFDGIYHYIADFNEYISYIIGIRSVQKNGN